jgi:hypothetical protein
MVFLLLLWDEIHQDPSVLQWALGAGRPAESPVLFTPG